MNDALAEDLKRSWTMPWPPARPVAGYVAIQLVVVPLLLGALAWTVQHGPLDLALARLFADPSTQSFVWRPSAWLDILGHQAARGLPIIVGGVALAAGIAGFFIAQLRPWRRILLMLGAAMIAGPGLINLLKTMTTQHCPSALSEFGGVVSYAADRSAPFWAATPRDAGHCLPSGHAGGGYALCALYFAGWAAGRPAWRWRGLAIGVAAGLVFSVVRMMQGAHFASATLWSAAIAWSVAALFFLPLVCGSASPRP
ncbi:MAG: phosphatase PAP2 family protein [Caldimonas sp.]